MRPAARVQAAIDILGAWDTGGRELDHVLRDWGRANRYAGSGDRRAIADLVYDTVRRKRSACWVAGASEPASPRDWVRGSLLLDAEDAAAYFTAEQYAPAPLSEAEQVDPKPLGDAPPAVRGDIPDWLLEVFGEIPESELDHLRTRAPLDLRVNLLKGDQMAAIAGLAEDDIIVQPVSLSPTALRVTSGARKVARSRAYAEGLIEIQDAASQAMADLARVQPGETVMDLCAGGGGKTLGLAAHMAGTGCLLAHDISPLRMAGLSARAARAGAQVEIVPTEDLGAWNGRCDLVYVDAPCSGSGAWRRNPDAKWRLTHDRLVELCGIQSALLDQAVHLCRPNGRIVFVTCSIIAHEGDTQIAAFLDRAAGWDCTTKRQLLPSDGGDGFYGAILENERAD